MSLYNDGLLKISAPGECTSIGWNKGDVKMVAVDSVEAPVWIAGMILERRDRGDRRRSMSSQCLGKAVRLLFGGAMNQRDMNT